MSFLNVKLSFVQKLYKADLKTTFFFRVESFSLLNLRAVHGVTCRLMMPAIPAIISLKRKIAEAAVMMRNFIEKHLLRVLESGGGFDDMDLKSCSITGRCFTIRPVYANACGNKFLIYDFIKTEAPIEDVRNAIWDVLPKFPSIDDGLLLCKVSQTNQHLAVKMHVLEPDRTEADFCGNGARSVGKYLQDKYAVEFSSFSLVSRRGNHSVVLKDGTCFIEMGKPHLHKTPLRFLFKGKTYSFYFCDAVEPHLVTQDFFDKAVLTQVGNQVNEEFRVRFPSGVNINCVEVENGNKMVVMTYERGLYRITQACGTGSTASLVTAREMGWVSKELGEYHIDVLGGRLEFFLDKKGSFWLGGDVLFRE